MRIAAAILLALLLAGCIGLGPEGTQASDAGKIESGAGEPVAPATEPDTLQYGEIRIGRNEWVDNLLELGFVNTGTTTVEYTLIKFSGDFEWTAMRFQPWKPGETFLQMAYTNCTAGDTYNIDIELSYDGPMFSNEKIVNTGSISGVCE